MPDVHIFGIFWKSMLFVNV